MMNDNLVTTWSRQRARLTRGQNTGEYIPTWQVGLEQGHPHDVGRFAADGYGKHGLIYACIKEKATSFSTLQPVIERADGKVVRDHRLIELLEDPNPGQDGQAFAEEMMTHFECAGNAYVEMVPQSGNEARRRRLATFPVQELRLIRPDYVSIEPGANRDADVFLVTVGGRVVKRIPRALMLHVHEPLVTNDYYGVSKIARIVREGAIDLEMSDFELSFFRNAGVPMGLLAVKGELSQAQTDEVKSRFRRAYNGVKKWFDLLVLNADNATYTQLGMKNSDMEMTSTRSQVERRICSVFGVPPIIVGALSALVDSPTVSPEAAEHQFWAETMVPESMRFARAYQRALLPQFATTRDRGARVTYDFTVVRALQEDRSRKLREVVRLVLTGGFTVNQALTMSGLPTIEGGDVYIRNGNQVVVGLDGTITRMTEGGSGPNLDNPLEGAARLIDPVREAERILETARGTNGG